MRTKILPPNPARLIEGLRDTGYNFNTALADIIDNSIDAAATKIDIQIIIDTEGDILIMVADNGCGMDEKTLLDGMTYGATGRPNPKRLGKFGLGLKTASSAFARRISVITRDSGKSELLKAVWDLDHVVREGAWELLLEDTEQEYVRLLSDTAPNSSGTLVVWEKVDRLLRKYSDPTGKHAKAALKKINDGFRFHAAMVFQRFLDPNDDRAQTIVMTLNGDPIVAWDPFCESEEDTELSAKDIKEVEIEGKDAEFSIRAFVLPRREHFSSTETAREAKISNKMQGFYIYRENRLIYPHGWMNLFSKEPHLSLLRIEFSFNHDLDKAFQVDIKKSRISLNSDLFNWIKNSFIGPPRNAAEMRYRKGQRKKASETSGDAHSGSNRSIADKEADLTNAKVKVVNSDSGEVEVENKSGKVRLKLKIGTAAIPGQVCVDPVEEIEDGLLWEPALIDCHHAVKINTGHPYYQKVYIPNRDSGVTILGMDSLLWALVEAELGTVNDRTKKHFEELRFEVSRLLRKLLEDLPEPDLSDDSDLSEPDLEYEDGEGSSEDE